MIIELQNGTRYDIKDFNLTRLYHYIPSIEVEHEFANVQGRSPVYVDSSFSSRTITVEFLFQAYDIHDYYAIRDLVNGLFTKREEFYIAFKNEPYKRYKVVVDGSFQVPPDERMQSFEIDFICTELYGEAIASTSTVKAWDENMWSWISGISWDDGLTYTFTEKKFTVNNLGTAPINPLESNLRIMISGNFPKGFTLRNTTTNETYQFTKALTTNDVLTIDRINTFVNGINRFSDTNRKLLTLSGGLNAFEIVEDGLSSISFDFRFLYL